MFRKRSDKVIVTVEFEDGTRMTDTARTFDGEWKFETAVPQKCIAWMPLPEPYRER